MALSASGRPLEKHPPAFHAPESAPAHPWISIAPGDQGLRGALSSEHTHFESDANITAQEAGPGGRVAFALANGWQAEDLPGLVAARVLNPSARGPPRA